MSHDGYRVIAESTIQFAEGGLIGPMGTAEKRNIRTLFTAIHAVDNYIDSLAGTQRSTAMQAVIKFVAGENGGIIPFCDNAQGDSCLVRSLTALKSIFGRLDPTQKAACVRSVETIFASSAVTSQTRETAPFIAAREKEGRAMAGLMLGIVTPMQKNALFGQQVKALFALCALEDSIVDYRSDKASRIIRVSDRVIPELSCRMREIGRELLANRHDMPEPAVIALTQRLTHGTAPA